MISQSNASKLAKIFDALSDYRAVLILDILVESEDRFVSEVELADEVGASESKVRGLCDKLERVGIVLHETSNETEIYKLADTNIAHRVRAMFDKLV